MVSNTKCLTFILLTRSFHPILTILPKNRLSKAFKRRTLLAHKLCASQPYDRTVCTAARYIQPSSLVKYQVCVTNASVQRIPHEPWTYLCPLPITYYHPSSSSCISISELLVSSFVRRLCISRMRNIWNRSADLSSARFACYLHWVKHARLPA